MNMSWSLDQALKLRNSSTLHILEEQKRFLRVHLHYAAHTPFYSSLFREYGLDCDEIANSMAMAALPMTSRKDIEQNPEQFHVPPRFRSDIVDISQTSGTSGRPLSVPLTRGDIDRLAFNEAVAFFGAGVRPGDRVILSVTMDRCFVAGLAYFSGCVKLGASAIRSGPGHPASLWELISEFNPGVMVGVPAHILETGRWAVGEGLDPSESGVRTIIAIGEPVRRPDMSLLPLGAELQELWGCSPVSTYAATEMQTCFCECTHGLGGHVHPELAVVEIVDEDGVPLPSGKPGEVVVTPLGVEGMPLVRYRTGDIARLITEPCLCGWNTPRLGPIEARLSQRLKYRGTTIYPEMIFQALQEVRQVEAAYIEVRADFDLSDTVTVVAGVRHRHDVDIDQLRSLLQARIRVKPELRIESMESVVKKMTEHGGRKPKRFFDYR